MVQVEAGRMASCASEEARQQGGLPTLRINLVKIGGRKGKVASAAQKVRGRKQAAKHPSTQATRPSGSLAHALLEPCVCFIYM